MGDRRSEDRGLKHFGHLAGRIHTLAKEHAAGRFRIAQLQSCNDGHAAIIVTRAFAATDWR